MKSYSEELHKLASTFGMTEIYVFGSRSKDIFKAVQDSLPVDNTSLSDIDIAITLPYNVSLRVDEKTDITFKLENIFNDNTVDLVIVNEAPPFLALDIIKGELIYCSDPIEQAHHELYILRKAGDLAAFERERRSMILYGDL